MNLFEILLLAIALGVDCLVVSFSQGLIYRSDRMTNALKLAITMGLFQGLMPFFGSVGANYIQDFIGPYSKLITLIIFLLLGMEFVLNSLKKQTEKEELTCMSLKCLIALGIATSIDALLSGIPLKFTYANNLTTYIIIGLTSFIMACTGFFITGYIKSVPVKKMQFIGGLILIFLGLKNFYF